MMSLHQLAMLRPLHEGHIGGVAWRAALFLTGVLPPFFALTGVGMAIAKRRRRLEGIVQ